MALITRVSRLFRADLNAILDRIEEPDIVLKQALRDMAEDLGHDQRRAKAMQVERARSTERATELTDSLSRLDEELNVCFDAQNESLAKSLVRRKLETQRMVRSLERHSEATAHSLQELQARIALNNSRLQAMQQQAEILDQEKTAETGRPDPLAQQEVVGDDDVEVAFLREKQSRQKS